MKIIDRYILREFILPFFYCFLAFFILYFIADLFEHMDVFLKTHTPWKQILFYYIFLTPTIYTEISPFCLALSLIYVLGNFARHHEIVGMRASGISSKRIAFPFLLLGLFLSTTFFYLNESWLPKARLRMETFKKTFIDKEDASQDSKIYNNLTYGNMKENYIFYMRELDLKTNTALDLQIHYLNPSSGSLEKLIRAQEGRWLDQEWWLFNGTIVRYDASGDIKEDPEIFLKRKASIFESPLELILEEKANEQMNYFEFKNYLLKKYGKKIPRPQKTELYSKISKPWIYFVLVLLVVPIGLEITRGGALTVLGKTLLFTFAYYSVQFFLLALGKQGYLDPGLACGLTPGFFGLWGAVKIIRLR
ncbi:MAG: LptF/LptG family permease [Chlamydiae bacterium]|nr:LptF/LptG family permease [Chlamydiota bacterium]MBI3277636.1 LptF/LptG family permease [Chlamydiota bacterium]